MSASASDRIPSSHVGGGASSREFPKPCPPLEEAFARWQDELLGTLYILLGSAQEAQEAFREAFLRCWRRREELAGLEDSKGWIFRAVLQTARQRRAAAWRRRWRLWDFEESSLAEGSPAERSPGAEGSGSEEMEVCRRALMELAPEEQEVFLLRQNAQMSYEQIASVLGTPVGAVKTQMRRALAQLVQSIPARNISTDPENFLGGRPGFRETEQPHPILPLLSQSVASPGQEEEPAKTSAGDVFPMW